MKKLLKTSSVLVIIVGIVLIVGGIWGACLTYKNVARENIVTPDDASVPNQPVRGPWTLYSEADIIREHTLDSTGGKTFAEMPRQIPKIDENGVAVLDEEGKAVMTSNTARDIWITATTLMTAINLGIISYAFSGFAFLLGLILVLIGTVFCALSRRY